MIYEVSLFSGAGGGLLASKMLGWKTILYCENDEDRREKLRKRIRDGCLDDAPIINDVRIIPRRMLESLRSFSERNRVIITGGPPCQPASIAGKRKGEEDERWLWWDAIGILGFIKPAQAMFENPSGLTSLRYGDGELVIYKILAEISKVGYDCRWTFVSAKDCGAQHERKRIWILANASGKRKL